jgi:hypothetical protein
VVRAARIWRGLGRPSALGLAVVGVLVIVDASLALANRLARPVSLLALALGASAVIVGAIRLWQTRTGGSSQHQIVRVRRRWTPFLVAALVYFIAFAIMSPTPTGDQGHYELESVGLAYDQSRDMTVNYTRPSRYRLVFRGAPGHVGEAFRYKAGGELVLVENVGLPLLLAPAVPLVREVRVLAPNKDRWPWNVEIILLAALAAQLLYRILERLRSQHPVLVAGVWASIVFSAPMVVYANQAYPEIPGVLLALIAVNALFEAPRRRTVVVGACACALLAWLHVRFLPIAALLALGLAFRALTAMPAQQRLTPAGVRSAAWALLPLLISLVVMGIAFQHWYGSPLPNAPYRLPQVSGFTPRTLSASWATLTGAFWSADRGWLPFAPVAILALASIGYAVRRYRMWTLFGLAVAGAYLLNLTIQGSSPGFSFAGRFAVILMPFAALPLLIAVADLAPVRWLFWPLAALTLYLGVAVVLEPPGAVVALHRAPVGTPYYPQLLWPWLVNIWPEILPSAGNLYPDAITVLAWTTALLAAAVAGYFVLPRATRRG